MRRFICSMRHCHFATIRRGSRVACFAFAACLCALIFSAAARADVFLLNNDGQLQGEEIKVPGTPSNQTVIRTAGGGQITLDKSQIKQIVPRSAAQTEYERIAPTYADTVADQWRLAEWCKQHSLPIERKAHLERVIALDPNHKPARAALGFAMLNGQWAQPEDMWKRKGFVKYKGKWVLPQDVELLEEQRKENQAEKDWQGKLIRWRKMLDKHPEKADELHDELTKIDDPAAVPAIEKLAVAEASRPIKFALIDELLHVGTSSAIGAVVNLTMDDRDEEVRLTALDKLVSASHPEVVAFYIAALKSDNNVRINRAALCLGRLGDKSAISPLIDVLRTTHRHVEQQGTPGQISTTFMNGPGNNRSGGMSVGGQTKEIVETLDNQEVLNALMLLSGGVNLQFDQQAWKAWYVGQMRSLQINARRG